MSHNVTKDPKHALIAGASGIRGWALVNTLLSDCPEAAVFTKITALTNRPLPKEISQWLSSAGELLWTLLSGYLLWVLLSQNGR